MTGLSAQGKGSICVYSVEITNKMQPCNRIYYSTVHWRLNMFRAAYPSSSRALTVFAASGLHTHVVTGRSQVWVGTAVPTQTSMNGGIINSITRLHPLGYFYWVIVTVSKVFFTARLSPPWLPPAPLWIAVATTRRTQTTLTKSLRLKASRLTKVVPCWRSHRCDPFAKKHPATVSQITVVMWGERHLPGKTWYYCCGPDIISGRTEGGLTCRGKYGGS